jgi:hypothetical protein
MSTTIHRFRRAIVMLTIVLAGSLVLATAPTALLADEREETGIERFHPITISESMIHDFDVDALMEEVDPITLFLIYMELQDIGSAETNLSKESVQTVDSESDVADHLNGAFAVPSYLPSDLAGGSAWYAVSDAGYASATFDVAKARRISELLDISPDWLPRAQDEPELTVRVDIERGGMAAIESGINKLAYGQIGMPVFEIPESLDVQLLIETIAEDPRLPDELAEQLQAIDDWEGTVPVPMPEDAEHRELEINGGVGLLVSIDEGSAVIWEADGTIYVVAGMYDADEIERVARSME